MIRNLILFLVLVSRFLFADQHSVNAIIGDKSYFDLTGHFPQVQIPDLDRIRIHLEFVESELRNSEVCSISSKQRAQRNRLLDLLNDYWKAGRFPVNHPFPVRTPCFIDEIGNICAVGYLIEQTVGRAQAEYINSNFRYEYLLNMHDPLLYQWIENSGFTRMELATIQPTYLGTMKSTSYYQLPDLRGQVLCLSKDSADNILVFGGKFKYGSISNIILIKDTVFLPLGNGFPEPVTEVLVSGNYIYAVVRHADTIYTVNRWDGKLWKQLGGAFNNEILTLNVFQHQLFVGGSFTSNDKLPCRFLACWQNGAWREPAHSFSNSVNCSITFECRLYVGGDSARTSNFMYLENEYWHALNLPNVNINAISYKGKELFVGGVSYNRTSEDLSAVKLSDQTIQRFSNPQKIGNVPVLAKLRGNSWTLIRLLPNGGNDKNIGIRSLCCYKDTLYVSGKYSATWFYTNSYKVKGFNLGIFSSNFFDSSQRIIPVEVPDYFSILRIIQYKDRFFLISNPASNIESNVWYCKSFMFGYNTR
jgi:hypothetical protein